MRPVRLPAVLAVLIAAAATAGGSALPAVAATPAPAGSTQAPTAQAPTPTTAAPTTTAPTTTAPIPTATATPAAPAAVTAAPAPATAPLDLTVVLTPTDKTRLHALVGQAARLSHAQRLQALAQVAPTATRRAGVAARLRAAGLQVTSTGTWDLRVTGTVAEAERAFDVDLTGADGSVHPTTTLRLPSTLAGDVTAVLGLDQRPIPLQHLAVPGGKTSADLASAYGLTRAGSTGAGTTVATVQFSGWNASDLTTYAKAVGVATPTVTQVSVDGRSTTPAAKGADGDGPTEVALDQEMLFATAPRAAQRVYFAPIDGQGIYDAYAAVAADAAKLGITTLSTSWGGCESGTSPDALAALQDVIDRIVVAGTTTFAASGDWGAHACDPSASSPIGVDYPADFASVVGVGGTTLNAGGGGWQETAWSGTTTDGYGTHAVASGGGQSTAIGRPSYQSGIAIAGTGRLVPDISAVADPNSGPAMYASGWFLGGGTSAAAPIAAGQLASTISSAGCTTGIGDIHAALYADRSAFRDVTRGSNGTYAATTGYDEATGLGSPNWAALATVLPGLGACSRTLTAPATLAAGHSITSPNQQFTLTMQTDGNLVEYGDGRALWASGTNGRGGTSLAVQADGNAVVYTAANKAVWASQTRGGSGAVLGLTDTGDLRLTKGSTVLWHTGVSGRDTLAAPVTLIAGQSIQDASGRRQLAMQADGNLVLYIDGRARWATQTAGYRGAYATLQADGNLVLYDAHGVARWASGTSRAGSGTRLVMQAGGNLVLTKGSTTLWSTHTKG